MKKISLGLLAISSLLFASCSVGNGENYQTVTYFTNNLVIPADGSDPTVTAGAYAVKFDFNDGTAQITSTVKVDNKDYPFSTNPVSYSESNYQQLVKGFDGLTTNGSMNISNGVFLLSAYTVLPDKFNPIKSFTPVTKNDKGQTEFLPGTMIAPTVQSVSPIVVARYNMGNEYTVQTFTTDAFYCGETSTSYGESERYTSKDIVYRLIMDVAKKKAALVIYNAKFSNSDREPVKTAIYVPDLDLSISAVGIKISGTDVIPYMPEVNALMADKSECTEQPDFVFNKFELVTTDRYFTSVNISYEVAGRYKGVFSGSNVKLPAGM